MKSLPIGRIVAASCVFSLPAMAVPLYWDGTGSTWGAAANWSTDPAAAVPDPAAAPGSTDTATFSTTSVTTTQTIGLGGNQSALGLVFNNQSSVTLNGGGTNSVLSLGTDGIIATGTTTSGGAPTRVYTIGNTTAGQNVSISLLGSQSWLSNLSGGAVNSGDGIYVRNGVSLGVTGTHTLTLGGTSGTTPLNTISGVVSDGGADRVLNININGGSVRWTLAGNNTYTGTTTVTAGALTLATSVNALGSTSAGTTVLSGAGLFFRGNVGSMAAESLTITGNGPDAKGALRNVGGTTNVWNGTIAATTGAGTSATIGTDAGEFTLSATADITTSGPGTLRFVGGGTTTVNGNISGPGNLSNTPAGGTAVAGALVILGGDSKTYTGTTTVAGGALRVNTSLTATTDFDVGAGGTLQGTGGTINTAITTELNGTGTLSTTIATLAPGAAAGTIGSITTGELSLGTFSRMIADVNYDGAGSSDRMNVSMLTIASGAALEVNLLGTSPTVGLTVLVINNAGVWNGGLFTVNGNTVADDSTFTSAGSIYQINYNYTGALGSGVALTLIEAVPEPGAAVLVGFAMVAAGLRRRRPANDR